MGWWSQVGSETSERQYIEGSSPLHPIKSNDSVHLTFFVSGISLFVYRVHSSLLNYPNRCNCTERFTFPLVWRGYYQLHYIRRLLCPRWQYEYNLTSVVLNIDILGIPRYIHTFPKLLKWQCRTLLCLWVIAHPLVPESIYQYPLAHLSCCQAHVGVADILGGSTPCTLSFRVVFQ